MKKIKCIYCGNEVPSEDSLYSANIHYDCWVKIQNEMEELGLIKVISRVETIVTWKFTESFEKFFYKTMDEVHRHILHDKTVDEDIITMQAVVKAIANYVPDSIPTGKISIYGALIFNNLMIKKYGRPLPDDKKFDSRMREFAEEVTSEKVESERITGKKTPKPIMIRANSIQEAFEKYQKEVYNRISSDLGKYLTEHPGLQLYIPTTHETPLLGWTIFLVKDGIIVGISTVHQYIHKPTGEESFGFEKDYDTMADEIKDNITKLLRIVNRRNLLS